MELDLYKTEIFGCITIACGVDYADDGESFDYHIHVKSEHPAQKDWGRVVFNTFNHPSNEEFQYLELIHNKVIKHIKKKIRKRTTRLLRNVRYKKIFDAQNELCYLCDKPLSVYDCTIDHVVPRSKGGKNTLRNILLVHSRCNHLKGSRLPTKKELEYLSDINQKVKKIHYLKY